MRNTDDQKLKKRSSSKGNIIKENLNHISNDIRHESSVVKELNISLQQKDLIIIEKEKMIQRLSSELKEKGTEFLFNQNLSKNDYESEALFQKDKVIQEKEEIISQLNQTAEETNQKIMEYLCVIKTKENISSQQMKEMNIKDEELRTKTEQLKRIDTLLSEKDNISRENANHLKAISDLKKTIAELTLNLSVIPTLKEEIAQKAKDSQLKAKAHEEDIAKVLTELQKEKNKSNELKINKEDTSSKYMIDINETITKLNEQITIKDQTIKDSQLKVQNLTSDVNIMNTQKESQDKLIKSLESQVAYLKKSLNEYQTKMALLQKDSSVNAEGILQKFDEEAQLDKETIVKLQYKIKGIVIEKQEVLDKLDELTHEHDGLKGSNEKYKASASQKLTLLKDQNTKLKKKTREQEEMLKTVEELQAIIQNNNKNVLPSNNLNQYNQIRELKETNIKLITKIETLEDEKKDLNDMFLELKAEFTELMNDLQRKNQRETELKVTIDLLKDTSKKKEAEKDDLGLKMNLLQLELDKIKKMNDDLIAKNNCEQSAALDDIEKLKCHSNVLKLDNTKKQQSIDNMTKQLKEYQSQVEKERESWKSQFEQLKNKLNEDKTLLQKQLTDEKKQSDSFNEESKKKLMNELNEMKAKYEAEIKKLNQRFDNEKKNMMSMNDNEKNDINQEYLLKQKAMNEKYEKEKIANDNDVKKERMLLVKKYESEKEELVGKYENEKEKLGNQLNQLKKLSNEEAMKLKSMLSALENDKRMLENKISSFTKNAKAEITSLQGQAETLKNETMEKGLEISTLNQQLKETLRKKSELEAHIEQLNNDLQTMQKNTTEAYNSLASKSKTEIASLQEKIVNLKNETSNKAEEIASLKKQAQLDQSHNKELEGNISQLKTDLKTMKEETTDAYDTLALKSKTEIALLQGQISNLKNETMEKGETISSLRQQVKEDQLKKKEMKDNISQLNSDFKKLKQETTNAYDDLSMKSKSEISSLQGQVKRLTNETLEKAASISSMKEQIQQDQAKKKEMQDNITQLKNDFKKLKQESNDAYDDLALKSKTQISSLNNHIAQLKNETTEKAAEITSLKDTINQDQAKKYQLQSSISQLENNLMTMKQETSDAYNNLALKSKAEINSLQAHVEKLNDETAEKGRVISLLNRQIQDDQVKKNALESTISQLENDYKTFKKQSNEAYETLDMKTKAEISSLQEQVEESKNESLEQRKKILSLNHQVNEDQAKQKEMESNLYKLHADLNTMKKEAGDSLARKDQEYQHEKELLQKQITKLNNDKIEAKSQQNEALKINEQAKKDYDQLKDENTNLKQKLKLSNITDIQKIKLELEAKDDKEKELVALLNQLSKDKKWLEKQIIQNLEMYKKENLRRDEDIEFLLLAYTEMKNKQNKEFDFVFQSINTLSNNFVKAQNTFNQERSNV